MMMCIQYLLHCTGGRNVWVRWFLAGNQDFDPFLIAKNLWLIIVGMKQIFFLEFSFQNSQLNKTEVFQTANSQKLIKENFRDWSLG